MIIKYYQFYNGCICRPLLFTCQHHWLWQATWPLAKKISTKPNITNIHSDREHTVSRTEHLTDVRRLMRIITRVHRCQAAAVTPCQCLHRTAFVNALISVTHRTEIAFLSTLLLCDPRTSCQISSQSDLNWRSLSAFEDGRRSNKSSSNIWSVAEFVCHISECSWLVTD